MHGFRAWLAMTFVSLHLHAGLKHGKHADSNKDAGACASAFFRRIDVVSLILTARLLVPCCDFWSRQPSFRRTPLWTLMPLANGFLRLKFSGSDLYP